MFTFLLVIALVVIAVAFALAASYVADLARLWRPKDALLKGRALTREQYRERMDALNARSARRSSAAVHSHARSPWSSLVEAVKAATRKQAS